MRRVLALLIAVLLMGATAACGDSSSSSSPSSASSVDMGDKIKGLSVSGALDQQPKVSVDPAVDVTKPQTQVITAGKGNPVKAGQEALLNIYLLNGTTGKKAISTWDSGVPVDVPQMSEQQLFKPVVDALVGKPQGSRVAVAAPVKSIYGKAGAGQIGLKPTDTAVFVVDIASVPPKEPLSGPKGDKVAPPAGAPTVKESGDKVTGIDFSKAAKTPGKKLQVIPLVKGTGPKTRAKSLVTFNYYGMVYGGKKPFDESYSKQPVTFALGMGKLIKGWDQGLVGLNEGSRVMIVVPPDQGYGSQAQASIPANSTLVFVVDILGVDK